MSTPIAVLLTINAMLFLFSLTDDEGMASGGVLILSILFWAGFWAGRHL